MSEHRRTHRSPDQLARRAASLLVAATLATLLALAGVLAVGGGSVAAATPHVEALAPTAPVGADGPGASTTTGGTLAPGQVTATQLDDGQGPGPNAGGTAGLVVFVAVMAAILGGGSLIYLRNRGRGNQQQR